MASRTSTSLEYCVRRNIASFHKKRELERDGEKTINNLKTLTEDSNISKRFCRRSLYLKSRPDSRFSCACCFSFPSSSDFWFAPSACCSWRTKSTKVFSKFICIRRKRGNQSFVSVNEHRRAFHPRVYWPIEIGRRVVPMGEQHHLTIDLHFAIYVPGAWYMILIVVSGCTCSSLKHRAALLRSIR